MHWWDLQGMEKLRLKVPPLSHLWAILSGPWEANSLGTTAGRERWETEEKHPEKCLLSFQIFLEGGLILGKQDSILPQASHTWACPLVTLAWPRTPWLSESAVGCARDAWTPDWPTGPLHPASSGYLLTQCQLLPSPVLAHGRPGSRVKKEAIHSEQSWVAVHMAHPSMDAGPCPLF